MLDRYRIGGTAIARYLAVAVATLTATASLVVVACAGGETVVTVEAPITTAPEVVVQTVVVERPVEVAGETVVQTVVVERPVEVAGETVVQTVVVERPVEVAGETVVQTVVVERDVERTVIVEQTQVVEVQVEVTPTQSPYGRRSSRRTQKRTTGRPFTTREATSSPSLRLIKKLLCWQQW